MKILYLSSVIPRPSTGGELIVHRHLQSLAAEVVIAGPSDAPLQLPTARFLERLLRTRFARLAYDLLELRPPPGRAALIQYFRQHPRPDLVLTVAHGTLCRLAASFARELRVPLVTIFHDWWPALVPVHAPLHSLVESRARQLYRDSKVAFCVSEPMQEMLGPHPGARLLHPLPAPPTGTPPALREGPFRLACSGLLSTPYGEMLGALSAAIADRPELSLLLSGPAPEPAVAASGHYAGFLERPALESLLASSHALLVAMSFDSKDRLRGETSFPSKLVEYCHYGKPLIVWGPETCSAIQWARRHDAAIPVAYPSPEAVVDALHKLRTDPILIRHLSSQAAALANTVFHPAQIQRTFVEGLEHALRS